MRPLRFYAGFLAAPLFLAAALSAFVSAAAAMPSGVFPEKYAAIVVDANDGRVLFSDRADMRRYPASLTKMMTLYLLFDAMQARRASPSSPIPISAYANSQPPTKLNLGAGQRISAEAAAKALITKSANDIAVAIAEYLGGSEAGFVRMMNFKARQLGMRSTHFANPSGLPNAQNYSSARDLAVLALALRRNFPQYYPWFSTTSFVNQGRLIRGHNRLVAGMAGVDGIKTGYTQMSGFNLASSRHIGNKSIVAIVMGGKSSALRDSHMAGLLTRYMDKAGGKKSFGTLPALPPAPPSALMAAAKQGGNAALVASAVPVPTPKTVADIAAEDSEAVQLAAAAGEPSGAAVMPVPQPAPARFRSDRERDSALLMMLAAQTGSDARRGSEAESALDNVVTASLPAREKAAAVAPHKAPHKKGWLIQLAASGSEAEARQILRGAEGNIRKAYAGAEPYTEKFAKSGKIYYRARFSGLPSKAAAKHSCARLKKAGRQCMIAGEAG